MRNFFDNVEIGFRVLERSGFEIDGKYARRLTPI